MHTTVIMFVFPFRPLEIQNGFYFPFPKPCSRVIYPYDNVQRGYLILGFFIQMEYIIDLQKIGLPWWCNC